MLNRHERNGTKPSRVLVKILFSCSWELEIDTHHVMEFAVPTRGVKFWVFPVSSFASSALFRKVASGEISDSLTSFGQSPISAHKWFLSSWAQCSFCTEVWNFRSIWSDTNFSEKSGSCPDRRKKQIRNISSGTRERALQRLVDFKEIQKIAESHHLCKIVQRSHGLWWWFLPGIYTQVP